MIYEPLEVVIVPFPFTDRQALKRRPALILSSEEFNKTHLQLILAMITSSSGHAWPSDVSLQDWRIIGLSSPCRVRFKLFTLDSATILRRVGPLSARDAGAVSRALSRYLKFR